MFDNASEPLQDINPDTVFEENEMAEDPEDIEEGEDQGEEDDDDNDLSAAEYRCVSIMDGRRTGDTQPSDSRFDGVLEIFDKIGLGNDVQFTWVSNDGSCLPYSVVACYHGDDQDKMTANELEGAGRYLRNLLAEKLPDVSSSVQRKEKFTET